VNVNLDITGGLLSFAQQAINAYNQDVSSFTHTFAYQFPSFVSTSPFVCVSVNRIGQ
jgi:hypothetical protein